jgi:hypothetical protein
MGQITVPLLAKPLMSQGCAGPLGSANEIKHLLRDFQLVSNNCPINVYGQAWTLMTENHAHARCAPAIAEGFARGKRCANKYPTLTRAEIPTHHIFGV